MHQGKKYKNLGYFVLKQVFNYDYDFFILKDALVFENINFASKSVIKKLTFQFKKVDENYQRECECNINYLDNYGKPFLDIYVPLDKLKSISVNTRIYVMGVVVSIDMVLRKIQKNGRKFTLRNFKISDTTHTVINVAIWDKRAENFSLGVGSVLRFDNVVISNYGGVSLEVKDKTTISNITGLRMSLVLTEYYKKYLIKNL